MTSQSTIYYNKMNILEREKLTAPEKPKEEEVEEEGPECLETKLVMWDDDEFEEL